MFRMNGMPRAQGCAGEAKHIHVSLDTRLPASYGGVLEILCQSFKLYQRGLHNDREIRF